MELPIASKNKVRTLVIGLRWRVGYSPVSSPSIPSLLLIIVLSILLGAATAVCCASPGRANIGYSTEGFDDYRRYQIERVVALVETMIFPLEMAYEIPAQSHQILARDLPDDQGGATSMTYGINSSGRLICLTARTLVNENFLCVWSDNKFMSVVFHEMGHMLGCDSFQWGGPWFDPALRERYHLPPPTDWLMSEDETRYIGEAGEFSIDEQGHFIEDFGYNHIMGPYIEDDMIVDFLFWAVVEETRGAPVNWWAIMAKGEGTISQIVPRQLRRKNVIEHFD